MENGNKFLSGKRIEPFKHDRKGNAATFFHHMIVCPYVATKTEEKEPGK
jgi:hypothetical protein